MTAVIDTTALNHLGAVIQRIRPQWDTPGITDALTRALADHPYPDVATVAISSARDPQANTPAVIVHRCRNGWTATPHDDVQRTHTPPMRKSLICDRCGHLKPEGDEQHRQYCGKRAAPDARQRAFAEQETP
jgi:hypothetical protein